MTEEKSASSYWLGETEQRLLKMDRSTPQFAMAMAGVKRIVAHFVKLITDQDLPVYFSTGHQSYATKDGKIIIAAVTDPALIDVEVGRAMHEGAHVILSNHGKIPESLPMFPVLDWLQTARLNDIFTQSVIDTHVTRLGLSAGQVRGDLKTVLNVIEDRRIDNWVYQRAAGYRQYYDKHYAHVWNSPEWSRKMRSPMHRTPMLGNYWTHYINMTNPAFDPNALPGLAEIAALIDLDHIDRFNTTGNDPRWATYQLRGCGDPLTEYPDIIATGIRILEIIYTNSQTKDALQDLIGQLMESAPDMSREQGNESESSLGGDQLAEDDKDINYDQPEENTQGNDKLPPQASEGEEDEDADEDIGLSKTGDDAESKNDQFDADAMEKSVQDLKDAINNEDQKASLPDEIANNINAVDEGKAKMHRVGSDLPFKTDVIVFNRLTDGLMRSPVFGYAKTTGLTPISFSYSVEAIKDGEQIGNMLASQLRIMADERLTEVVRQKSGRLDPMMIAGLGVGLEDVFMRSSTERLKPVQLHISVDASTSMGDGHAYDAKKWQKAMTFAAAMAKASEKIRTLDVVVSVRSGGGMGNHTTLAIIFDSKKDKYNHVRKFWPYLRPEGGTPEGLAFESILDMLTVRTKGVRSYFVNLSDGMPTMYYNDVKTGKHFNYSGDMAIEHTGRMVAKLRKAGVTVLSYFIKSDKETVSDVLKESFTAMYGAGAEFVNAASLPDITRTMNKMFKSK